MKPIPLTDYLLVSPALSQDVIEKQGQIGLLIIGHEEEDSFFLRFQDGQLGAYSAGDLLALKTANELLDLLDRNGAGMAQKDFRALINITYFLNYGNMSAQKSALSLARTNEFVLHASTVPLSELLGRQHHRHIGR
jgi:hypothetical protein